MFVMPNYNFHMEFKRVSSNCKTDMWQKIENKSELKGSKEAHFTIKPNMKVNVVVYTMHKKVEADIYLQLLHRSLLYSVALSSNTWWRSTQIYCYQLEISPIWQRRRLWCCWYIRSLVTRIETWLYLLLMLNWYLIIRWIISMLNYLMLLCLLWLL